MYFSGYTTHLILLTTENEDGKSMLQQSKKLQHIKNFKHKPHVVNLDWLTDCLEQGQILDAQQYLIEMWSYEFNLQ